MKKNDKNRVVEHNGMIFTNQSPNTELCNIENLKFVGFNHLS